MPHIEFFGPAVDIVLFCLAFYILLYSSFAVFIKDNVGTMLKIDIRFSLAALFLILANYYGSGASFSAFGFDMHWFIYYLLVSFVVEGVILLAYRKIYGIDLLGGGK